MEIRYRGEPVEVPDSLLPGGTPVYALAEFLIEHVLRPAGITVSTRCDQVPVPAEGYRCVYTATVHEPGGYSYEGTPGELWQRMPGHVWCTDPQIAVRAREAAVLQAVLEYGGCRDLAQRFRSALRASIRRQGDPGGDRPPGRRADAAGTGEDASAGAAGARAAEQTRGQGAAGSAGGRAPAEGAGVFREPRNPLFLGLTPAEAYRKYRDVYRWRLAAMLCAEREHLQTLPADADTDVLRQSLDRIIEQMDTMLQAHIGRLVAAVRERSAGAPCDMVGAIRGALPEECLRRFPGLLVAAPDGSLAAVDFRSHSMSETEAMTIAAAIAEALEGLLASLAHAGGGRQVEPVA